MCKTIFSSVVLLHFSGLLSWSLPIQPSRSFHDCVLGLTRNGRWQALTRAPSLSPRNDHRISLTRPRGGVCVLSIIAFKCQSQNDKEIEKGSSHRIFGIEIPDKSNTFTIYLPTRTFGSFYLFRNGEAIYSIPLHLTGFDSASRKANDLYRERYYHN